MVLMNHHRSELEMGEFLQAPYCSAVSIGTIGVGILSLCTRTTSGGSLALTTIELGIVVRIGSEAVSIQSLYDISSGLNKKYSY